MNSPRSLAHVALALIPCALLMGCSDPDPVSPPTRDMNELAKGGYGRAAKAISTEEADDLTYIREEEKLARDIYVKMYERWNRAIFYNISASEDIHMSAIYTLLDRYDLPDPVGENPVGVFTNGVLQDTYYQLLAQGNISFEEALNVGVRIETTDIEDLTAAIARTDNQDIARTYEHLRRGSQHHLSAFTRHTEPD